MYSLAHYCRSTNKLYINNFEGGMLVLDGCTITSVPNGQDGILFVTSSMAAPFKYLPTNERVKNATVKDFLGPINCDPQLLIAPDETKDLLSIWLYSMFFPELHRTKVIPTFIGPQGATKTTTARRFGIFLIGKDFDVGQIESADRGEQSFIATICGKAFCVFDNADAPVKWLPDKLATYATGNQFEMRVLYTTNELGIFKPSAHIVITSRDPHFRRPDVAERLLIVKLKRPDEFIPEVEVIEDILTKRDSVWSDLLDSLNWVLNALQQVPVAPRMAFRMADFASFGWRLSMAQGGEETGNAFQESLKKLEKEQSTYVTEEDPVTMCLGIWLRMPNYNREIDTGTLYAEMLEIAKKEGLMLPRTSASFGKRLRQAKKAIEMSLDIKISGIQTTHTSRWSFKPVNEDYSENFPENTLPTQPNLDEYYYDGGQEGEDE